MKNLIAYLRSPEAWAKENQWVSIEGKGYFGTPLVLAIFFAGLWQVFMWFLDALIWVLP